jgi:hypothetical protein
VLRAWPLAFWMQTRSVEVDEGRLGKSKPAIGSVRVIDGSAWLLHFSAARSAVRALKLVKPDMIILRPYPCSITSPGYV